jgi:hypothetical protein
MVTAFGRCGRGYETMERVELRQGLGRDHHPVGDHLPAVVAAWVAAR